MTSSRRNFLANCSLLTVGTQLPGCSHAAPSPKQPSSEHSNDTTHSKVEVSSEVVGGNAVRPWGMQLYTLREDMKRDAEGTLQWIADLGIREIETARSDQGHYYGMQPEHMKQACQQRGMTLRSGHVHLDEHWKETMKQAVAAGQQYLICSSLPSREASLSNYKQAAERFNEAGAQCRDLGLQFGYHNHSFEFEAVDGTVLYDVLLGETDPELVTMELDLGWVVAAGRDPLEYFEKHPGRFALWHLKDMNVNKQQSTEFGLGSLDIPAVLRAAQSTGVQQIFVEQERYTDNAKDSMRQNMLYLSRL